MTMSDAAWVNKGVPWLTVLSTKLRPQYLLPTLEALDLNGGAVGFPGPKIVMFDGGLAPVRRFGWAIQALSPDGVQLKQTRAFVEICKRAVIADCPYVLYFEDDVFPCRDAIRAMVYMEVPKGVSFLTFCNQKDGCDSPWTPHIEARRADAPANHPGHWGCQALKLPRRTLEICSRLTVPDEGYLRIYYDNIIGEFTASRKSPEHHYGIVLPAMFRHTGEITTVEGQVDQKWEGHRLGLNYAGDQADGLELGSQLAVNGGVQMWSRNEEPKQQTPG